MYYIYKIENLINGKKYIGLTNNIQRRRNRHFTDLNCGRHDNHFMQKEYDIFGKDNFSFEMIEKNIPENEISEKEVYYIEKFDSYYNGYNQNKGGNFGASNGGTKLTKSDLFNILSALEFMSRPGQVLSDIYDVTKTTISRIKQGVNHNQIKDEYDNFPLEKRKEIYQIFCDSFNFCEMKYNTSKLESKRKLTREQVYLVYLNEEKGRIITLAELARRLGLKSDNTLYTILHGITYRDYKLYYDKLSNKDKEKLVSLLRNQQK